MKWLRMILEFVGWAGVGAPGAVQAIPFPSESAKAKATGAAVVGALVGGAALRALNGPLKPAEPVK